MKQDRTAILALIGAISVTKAIKLNLAPDELPTMYADPEYANTWRWTQDPRYVNESQWEVDIPSGYDTGLALAEVDLRSSVDIPDYTGWDYSGSKHWKFANDKFYADPDEWIDSSPKGYDDYVNDDSVAQVESNNVPGVTFYPGRKQKLAQAASKTEIPDYSSWDYSGEKHWKFANDRFYANPEEWIDSAPAAYDVDDEPASLAQTGRKPFPGVTFVGQSRQGLAQVQRKHKWENKIPNPSAWTSDHYDNTNEEQYDNDSPQGYSHPSFAQHSHHHHHKETPVKEHKKSDKSSGKKKHNKKGKKKHHKKQKKSMAQHHHHKAGHAHAHGHHQPKPHHHKQEQVEQEPMVAPHAPSFAPRNFIYPAGTHSIIVPYITRDEAWNTDEYNMSNEKEYGEDRPEGYYYDE